MADEASFEGTLNFDFGGNGTGSIDFSAMDAQTASVGQETVTYSWNGATNTLTATITSSPDAGREGAILFTTELLDPTTGEFKVTLELNVLHAEGPNNENSYNFV